MPPQLTLDERLQIKALLLHTTRSHASIASTFHCHPRTIDRLAKLYKRTSSVLPRKRPGRKRKLNFGKQRTLRLALRSTPNATRAELTRYMSAYHNVMLSPRTIHRERQRMKLRSVGEAMLQSLTPRQKKQRLQYATSNLTTNWKLVLFCDEQNFPLRDTSNRCYIEPGRDLPARELKQKKYSCMVWGCIFYNGRSEISIATGSINRKRYINILNEYLLPVYPNSRFRLLQDNAGVHTAKDTQDFLREFAVNVVPHYPANSPDCNPIELIWSQLSRLVNQKGPTSPQQLHEAIEKSWDEIPQVEIQKVIDRLPTVMQGIIEKRGER